MFKILRIFLGAITAVLIATQATAVNNTYYINASDAAVITYLTNPNGAVTSHYDLKDSAGNVMQHPSIIQVAGQQYKYAAVYHTPVYLTSTTYRLKLNLAGSNNLINWTFIGQLVDNADMPMIVHVQGSPWIMLTFEQYLGSGAASNSPAKVGYKLYYTDGDLMNRSAAVSWTAPKFQNDLNGTPSIYDAHMVYDGVANSVSGQYGFHFWNGSRDLNAVTTIDHLFDPRNNTVDYPSIANTYNDRFIAKGVTGNIGARDTLITTTKRFNIQEGNIGRPALDFDKWRVYLYKFDDSAAYPTGNGTISLLQPQTAQGSTSFGSPTISVVDSPTGSGKVLVVSYIIFAEGAKPGEAGTLIYYYNVQ